MRTASIFVALSALARFVVATPPACLIAAVGVQSNPADTKTLCGTGKQWVIANITEACEGVAETQSLKIYKDTCLEIEGVTISLPTAASTSTSTSPSKTGSATKVTSTSTNAATSINEDDEEEAVWDNGSATNSTGSVNSTGSDNSTGTGANSPQSTGAGSSLSASSSVFLGSVIAIAGLASQFL